MSNQALSKEEMAKQALKRIRAISRGNGAEKDSIKIIRNSAELVRCEALTHVEITHKIKEGRKAGKHPEGEPIENLAALPKKIEKLSSEAIKNIEMRKTLSNILLSRDDQGFALHDAEFDIPPLNKEFFSFQPCETCQGNGQTTCQACGGQKREPCNKCHGRTVINCNYCHGSGTIQGAEGKQTQCNRCFGKGQLQCPQCQSRGYMPCRQCKGSGSNICNGCKGNGVFTFMTHVFFKMKTLFEIDRAALPHPVVKIIENNGDSLVKGRHIKLEGQAVKREDGGLAIQYNVEFPYASIDVGVNGKPLKVHMFGYKAKMLKISNFLNQLVEKNYALLQRAADNDGNIMAHIHKASKTRIIGEGLLLSVQNRPKKAMLALKKKYPYGASNSLIRDIILQSNKALNNVTQKSHITGMIIGLTLGGLMNALYFLTPLREKLSAILQNDIALGFADFLFLPLGGIVGYVLSGYLSVAPLKKALSSLMSEAQQQNFKPQTNNSPLPVFIGSAVIFIIIVFLTTIIPVTSPGWFPF